MRILVRFTLEFPLHYNLNGKLAQLETVLLMQLFAVGGVALSIAIVACQSWIDWDVVNGAVLLIIPKTLIATPNLPKNLYFGSSPL